jgi:enamine deaminase RidA (YjgF/YER057c/UK114 family)
MRQTLAAIDGVLEAAGADKTKLLHASIFLQSMADDVRAVSRVWAD